MDNHDNPRFLNADNNTNGFKSALAFTLTSIGVPITYYGSEQGFAGGADPKNREPLWTSMDNTTDLYKFFRTVNTLRRHHHLWTLD